MIFLNGKEKISRQLPFVERREILEHLKNVTEHSRSDDIELKPKWGHWSVAEVMFPFTFLKPCILIHGKRWLKKEYHALAKCTAKD